MRDQLATDGYQVVKGLLPERDLATLQAAYVGVLDGILGVCRVEARSTGLPENIEDSPFPDRFAALLGFTNGTILHHIDPVLSIFEDGFRLRSDWPDIWIPELFNLFTHPRVLDRLERHLGPEITASPIQHVNVKLAFEHLKLARRIARSGGAEASRNKFSGFQVGKTRWHMDAIAGLRDSHHSNIVNVWIPVTPATERNGCLKVVPGSHRGGVRYPPYPRDLDEKGVSLPVEPGDVVFLSNTIMHSSMHNVTDADYRWAFNFRFLPSGQPHGRPFLPAFVARSRSSPDRELRDPALWRGMWRSALDYVSRNGPPFRFEDLKGMDRNEASEITRRWDSLVPEPHDWLKLRGP